jgi:hypothetical protein
VVVETAYRVGSRFPADIALKFPRRAADPMRVSHSTDQRAIRRIDARAAQLERQRIDGLHVCPSCASKLVMPIAWCEAGRAHWDVTLQCPDCEWLGGGVYDEELIERFDEELDRGTEALVRDLHRLIRANMEDEIDRFAAALAADAILPEDF